MFGRTKNLILAVANLERKVAGLELDLFEMQYPNGKVIKSWEPASRTYTYRLQFIFNNRFCEAIILTYGADNLELEPFRDSNALCVKDKTNYKIYTVIDNYYKKSIRGEVR